MLDFYGLAARFFYEENIKLLLRYSAPPAPKGEAPPAPKGEEEELGAERG